MYAINVLQSQQQRLQAVLRAPCNALIFDAPLLQGYAAGSTEWQVVLESDSTAQRIKDVLWADGIGWCSVRPLTQAELDNL